MRNCQNIQPDLSAYVDGELTPSRRAEIEAHVASCPDCQRELAGLRTLAAGVAALPRLQPAPRFLAEVRAVPENTSQHTGAAIAAPAGQAVHAAGARTEPAAGQRRERNGIGVAGGVSHGVPASSRPAGRRAVQINNACWRAGQSYHLALLENKPLEHKILTIPANGIRTVLL